MRATAHGPGVAAGRRFTLVSFHAHPDDESLLTGGTLAALAAAGHRVVLVTATDGARGLAGAADGTGPELARRRRRELEQAASILGCARVILLGFQDSGLHPGSADATVFAHLPVEDVAARLAAVLREEQADALTIYDPHGGYGHPDHVMVHRAGVRAAALAGTPLVLEATVPARLFRGALSALRLTGSVLGNAPLGDARVFADPGRITHRIRVTRSSRAKRAAMAAHGSQRRAPGQVRVLDRLVQLPLPLFALVFGHEWYVEHGSPPRPLQHDLFASLRKSPAPTRRRPVRGLLTRSGGHR